MYCVRCGNEIKDGDNYCYYCGKELAENKGFNVKPKPVWTVFARVSYILGIVSLCTCIFPIATGFGIYGIIFSILGSKSIEPRSEQYSKRGRIMSIIGCAISSIVMIAAAIIFILLVIFKKS